MIDARTNRTGAALVWLWPLSAAALGSLAGLPWIWLVCGPVPSMLFAAFAGAEALRLSRSRAAPDGRLAVAMAWGMAAAAVGFVFGDPSSYSWLDRCFNPWGTEGVSVGWRLVVAAGAFVVFGLIVLVLQARARFLRTMREAGTEEARESAIFRSALWLAAAGIAWSLVNEGTVTNIIDDFRFGPCEPDVGRVALLGYGVATACLAYLAPRAARRRWPGLVALGCAATLLAGQSVRCVMIARDKQEVLARCGGPEACHCTDCSWWHWQ